MADERLECHRGVVAENVLLKLPPVHNSQIPGVAQRSLQLSSNERITERSSSSKSRQQ